jgi:hypothetical protein
VIKHLLGCALEFNWIPILQVAVNCCPWLEENYLAIGLQLFAVKDWDNYSDIVGVSLSLGIRFRVAHGTFANFW